MITLIILFAILFGLLCIEISFSVIWFLIKLTLILSPGYWLLRFIFRRRLW